MSPNGFKISLATFVISLLWSIFTLLHKKSPGRSSRPGLSTFIELRSKAYFLPFFFAGFAFLAGLEAFFAFAMTFFFLIGAFFAAFFLAGAAFFALFGFTADRFLALPLAALFFLAMAVLRRVDRGAAKGRERRYPCKSERVLRVLSISIFAAPWQEPWFLAR